MRRRSRRMRRARRIVFRVSRHGRAPWRRGFAALFAFALLVAAPIGARAQGAGADSVRLTWTAPGDDGALGTAALYDLRMSASAISLANWDQATPVAGLPAPLAAGSAQETVVQGLTQGTTYYFAIRSRDDAGNWSGVSNLVRWDWILDTAPPAAPTGLQASRNGRIVQLQWSPNAEPDLQGYSVYRADSPSGTFTRLNDTLLAGAAFTDDTVPPNWTGAAYKLTATDASGNESARSGAAAVSFAAGTPSPATLAIQPPYPNPSRGSDPVRIPLVVPAGGSAGAFVDILDSGGHRVRRLDLSGTSPGTPSVTWDGKNESGRSVAPGVYTAMLVAGDDRQRVRLVRTP